MESIERFKPRALVRARMDVRVESLYELPGVPLEGPGIKSVGIKVGRERFEPEEGRNKGQPVRYQGQREREVTVDHRWQPIARRGCLRRLSTRPVDPLERSAGAD